MTRDDVEEELSREGPPEGPSGLPRPGEIFDTKYRIERAIGQGAMAVVFEATHLQLQDRVAIKLLLPQWAENPEFVERFMREGRAATRIRSEHVVRVFDVGVAGPHPYLVMEFLDGSDLDQLLVQGGALPVATAIDDLLQACEAIAEAHVRGIIHRDLKPANLFLTRRADGSPCVKVLDFGISKATGSHDTRATGPTTVMGSPQYMSPEQMLSSRDVDARSDIWALGAILHELLVALPPFAGETVAEVSAAVLRDAPPPLTSLRADVPAAVEAAVLRCLEKDPAKRFADVAELAGVLAELGGASARASAERIARVLEGGAGAVSVPLPGLSAPPETRMEREPRTERAVSLLRRLTLPPRAGHGPVLGYVVAALAFVSVGVGISWMVVKDRRAVNAAEQRQVDPSASAAASAVSVAAGASGAAPASVAARVGLPASTPGPIAAPAPAVEATRPSASSAQPSVPPSAGAGPRPATHSRWPRRGPHPQPRPPPLPDFPVPSADPAGEPSSRPILAPPPGASPAPPVDPAATPAPGSR